jgi:hypothetical protein
MSEAPASLSQLSLLARGLAGIDVALQPLGAAAGTRAVLAGRRLLLPEGGTPQARRAMVAHAVAHLRHSTPAQPARALKPLAVAVASAIEDARVERLLCRDFPGLHGWFAASLAPLPNPPDPRDLGFAALAARLDRMLLLPAWQDDNHWVNKARRLFDEAAARAGLEDGAAFRAVAAILANDLGQMRVRFEPRGYAVPAPYRDDNSHLWDFGETQPPPPPQEPIALQQLAASAPNGGGGAPSSSTAAADVQPGRYSYPEWDHRLERLRPGWCTVIEKPPAWQGLAAGPAPPPPHGERMAPGAWPRERHPDRAHRLRRQRDGDELDMDAAIAAQVERRLRLPPDPRVFMRPGRSPRPSSVLVLLDLSASANDAATGPGTDALSLLDIEKQAALLLAASNGGDANQRLAIHGFSSNTRAEVYYCRLLDFGQPLDAAARATLGAVRGRYSTRMGAALRHATAQLRLAPEGRRALLLVTDGAPADIDVHDPRYLVEDARQAVAEARAAGVQAACLAVGHIGTGDGDSYVRRIFGWRHHGIADDARSLPQRLLRMRERLGLLRPG